MKFSVTKEKLLECLQQVQNVVSTRTTLPILSNVLLQANGERSSPDDDRSRCRRARQLRSAGGKGRRDHAAGAPPLHHHSRAALERNSIRRRWQERRLDPQRPELLQNPRPARGRVSAASEIRRLQSRHHPAEGFARRSAQDLVRHLDRRDALRPQRRPLQLQGQQAHARRDRWPPARDARHRSGISAQPRGRHHRADQGGHGIAAPADR